MVGTEFNNKTILVFACVHGLLIFVIVDLFRFFTVKVALSLSLKLCYYQNLYRGYKPSGNSFFGRLSIALG